MALVVALIAVAGVLPVQSRSRSLDERSYSGDFFIVSSVDVSKGQLLLKLPTEVTEVMRVNNDTRYLDEEGRPIKLTDLRAGDTVYINQQAGSGGALAVEIRKGPMTIAELRRRYLRSKK